MANDPENDLWQFAVRLYGRDGVAPACLRLQDRHGIDIPLLMFAGWLSEKGVTLSPQKAAEARDWVVSWHQEIVCVLRVLRRRLKVAPTLVPPELAEGVRLAIERAELDSEKAELALLARNSQAWRDDGAAAVDPMANLELMFAVMSGPAPTLALRDLEAIAASHPGGTP